MLVDPNTGMPMADTALDAVGGNAANSFAGQVGLDFMNNNGIATPPLAQKYLETLPGALTTMGWNRFRGARTIMKGPKNAIGREAGALSSTFNPKYFGRLSSYKALGGAEVESIQGLGMLHPRNGQYYTPFNILASTTNSVISKAANKSGRVKNYLEAHNLTSDTEEMVGKGSFARIGAMSRISRGGQFSGVEDFVKSVHPTITGYNAPGRFPFPYGTMPKGAPSIFADGITTRQQAVHAVGMTTQGTISSRIAGYTGTALAGDIPAAEKARMTSLLDVGEESKVPGIKALQSYARGSAKAMEHMDALGLTKVNGKFGVKAGGEIAERLGMKLGEGEVAKLGAGKAAKFIGKSMLEKGGQKAALKVGGLLAANAIPVVGQVMDVIAVATLAYDLTKMGIDTFKSTVDFGRDAYKSATASLNKPIMGIGYKDNSVAATSRQRGVMAIQNSRLNARSVLGSEAGYMASHFG